MRDGFTEAELSKKTLDGFLKWTKSSRIMRLVHLAYWRGMMRGVSYVKEMETPIVLRELVADQRIEQKIKFL